MPAILNSRALAALAMLDVVDEQKSLTSALAYFAKQGLEQDKPLLQSLCFGCSRYFFSINALSKILLDKPLPESARPIQALLWVGLYQLAHSDISEHAAINETVEACDQLKLGKFKGVLNAILRRFQREKTELLAGLTSSDVTLYEHPKWFIKLLKKNWPDQWQTICEQGNLQAPLCLRNNVRSQDRSDYLQTLSNHKIKAVSGKHALTSIYLEQACDVTQLPGFSDASCSVQDEAAQLAAQLLAPQKGERILDACSAPGGKTCHILEYADNQADVIALDADAKRLTRVTENLERLKLDAKVIQGEAQTPETWWDGNPFDRILLDVPCSATGVIRRHPDIKLLRKKEDIDNLAQLQGLILKKAWEMLRPGGTLLYATCSILSVENSDNISAFLADQHDAQLEPMTLSSGINTGFGWQLFPQANGHDGFFYALLKKQL
ncbi:16S rRNA (cytosine(967)-C(5))-methyltransferase RsmB [Bermanella sp. WJH001]|uniref:16S rRNA (cytosine(967)-C(5))-methyltransferase RsmB n=1 Tax=Bermanella sp. WJH001 TaxID=3048005 RepID=UPI0024BE7940|nr:16S rRNA (cytosine(967)-C(5))-methyltransferase RsmB [Bermanella sp. WJH001]MDJ1538850.1 16S rRNA (cytosine(967)-C(5))-methyltransferase RsmB [Bermanella sp. WJH001]